MPLVEADRPRGCGPGADQQRAAGSGLKETEKSATDSPALIRGTRVSMSYQGDVANILDPHDARKAPRLVPTKEIDSSLDFLLESRTRHVGLVPAIERNHASIRLRRLVDDGFYGLEIGIGTGSNHHRSSYESFSIQQTLHPHPQGRTRRCPGALTQASGQSRIHPAAGGRHLRLPAACEADPDEDRGHRP